MSFKSPPLFTEVVLQVINYLSGSFLPKEDPLLTALLHQSHSLTLPLLFSTPQLPSLFPFRDNLIETLKIALSVLSFQTAASV